MMIFDDIFSLPPGYVKYMADRDCMVWYIRQLPGQKEFAMNATFGLPSIGADAEEVIVVAA
jgi:hypothetical protein